MKNQPTISLKSYLIKSQTLLSLVLLTVFMSGLTIISTHSFKKYAEQNLQLIAQSLGEQLQAPLVFEDRQDIEKTMQNYMQRYDLAKIELERMDTQLIYEVKDQKSSSSLIPIQALQKYIISNDAGVFIVTHNGLNMAKISLHSNSNPLVNFINLLLIIFIFCIFIAIFVVALSTRFFSRKINTSLDLLTHTTELVAEKKAFHLRVTEGGVQEFNVVSHSFNTLLNEIQSWENHLQETNSNLEHRVLHDNLTLLPNRSYFQQRINQLFNDAAHRNHFALLFIDNDNFKEINDKYGHQVGDAVLIEMSQRLKQSLRHDDFIARLGGDEFAVLLSNIYQPEHAISVASHLIRATESPMVLLDKTEIHFSFSIGIAISIHAHNAEQLIHSADLAMYQAKINKHRKWAMFEH